MYKVRKVLMCKVWIHKCREFKRSGCKRSKFRRSGLKRRLSSVFGYSDPVVQRKTYIDRQIRQAYSYVDKQAEELFHIKN
jgi:hypothetical protein